MRKLIVFVVLLAVSGSDSPASPTRPPAFAASTVPQLTWQPIDERVDAKVVSHGCVGDDARQGSGSERVTIVAPGGESMHFVCPVGRIPVLDELEVADLGQGESTRRHTRRARRATPNGRREDGCRQDRAREGRAM